VRSDGDVERRFTKDEILTNVTLYWLRTSIAKSMRMYHANAAIPAAEDACRVEGPSGPSLFPADTVRPTAGVGSITPIGDLARHVI
jgi:hypothetical protein